MGPLKEGSAEGSKEFSNNLWKNLVYQQRLTRVLPKIRSEIGYDFLETLNPPFVLKADGLAAGKGVLIIDNLTEAKAELKAMLADAKFGDASLKL